MSLSSVNPYQYELIAFSSIANTITYTGATINPFIPIKIAGGEGPKTFVLNNPLSNSLAFDSSTGTISGTTTGTLSTTNYSVVSITDSAGNSAVFNGSNSFSLTIGTILTASQSITSQKIKTGVGINNFTPVYYSGGAGSVTYSISPNLPSGLSINSSTGVISGTASGTSSSTPYTITVRDSSTNPGAQVKTYSLSVSVVSTLSYVVNNSSVTLSQYVSTSFTPIVGSGGSGTYSYSISPTLPSGLSFNNSTGQITGYSNSTQGVLTYTVYISDTTNNPGNQTTSSTFGLSVVAFSTNVTFYAVGGGGYGNPGPAGGGGGGGGYSYVTQTVSLGTPYTIVVGGAGSASTVAPTSPGTTIVNAGGGYTGGSRYYTGAVPGPITYWGGEGGTSGSPQNNLGGYGGKQPPALSTGAAGGGGAGGSGGNGTDSYGGGGGPGVIIPTVPNPSNPSPSASYGGPVGGGGGGQGVNGGGGGFYGGGQGGYAAYSNPPTPYKTATDGAPGTGGGGGGADSNYTQYDAYSGNGGSGIVIAQYNSPIGTAIYTVSPSSNFSYVNGTTVSMVFTVSGSFT
jgi:Putative Ig domain